MKKVGISLNPIVLRAIYEVDFTLVPIYEIKRYNKEEEDLLAQELYKILEIASRNLASNVYGIEVERVGNKKYDAYLMLEDGRAIKVMRVIINTPQNLEDRLNEIAKKVYEKFKRDLRLIEKTNIKDYAILPE